MGVAGGGRSLGLVKLPGAPEVWMEERGREREATEHQGRQPYPTSGGSGRESPQGSNALAGPNLSCPPLIPRKRQFPSGTLPPALPPGPSQGSQGLRQWTNTKGLQGPQPGPMWCQDPVAHQVCQAVSGPVLFPFPRESPSRQGGGACPGAGQGWQAPGSESALTDVMTS